MRLATRVVAGCVLVVAAVSTMGCGGSSDDTDDAATEASVTTAITDDAATEASVTTAITDDTPVPTEAPAGSSDTASPDELGDSIAVLYLAVYDDVITALDDRPDPAEATTRLTALKDQYIEQLVELGWQREALDAPARATVDAKISSALMGLPTETLAEYQTAINDYAGDAELDTLIQSFNIIGQYANFELLREQEPSEAARLGID
jgi:hypothetical protein